MSILTQSSEALCGTSLQLIQGFELRCDDEPVLLPEAAQRLVAYLAVKRRPQRRLTVAGMLWMDTTDEQAAANLRTVLWRARRVDPELVLSDNGNLRLGDHVRVDLHEMVAAVHALVDDPSAPLLPETSAKLLCEDLLPDWCDDWVVLERERLRQVRLHGLEALCLRLTALGRFLHAIEVGLLATAADPLRESAQRALVMAHLAEGNVSEAVRQYAAYKATLAEELGVEPTPVLRALVGR